MKKIDLSNKRIVVSRTDSIGDVMLTLPICAWIKDHFPTASIIFLGKGYTKPIVEAYQKVDLYVDWKDIEKQSIDEQVKMFVSLNADVVLHVFPNKRIARLAKKAKIKDRIGTSHRLFHLLTCNHLLNFTRKRSELHESQLNHELLKPFGLEKVPSLKQIAQTTKYFKVPEVDLPSEIQSAILSADKTIILHPKSQGSAREWPITNYCKLTELLLAKKYTVFFTGTENEGRAFRNLIPNHQHVIDTTGKLSLDQLIKLIASCDTLVACSTGPLHISGFVGTQTIGLFSPRRPIHPGRWQAIGSKVTSLVYDEECLTCAEGNDCGCIEKIDPNKVMKVINTESYS